MVAAVFLACSLPLVVGARPAGLALAYLMLLSYLIHHIQEDYGGHFRRFIHQHKVGVARQRAQPAGDDVAQRGRTLGIFHIVLLLAGCMDLGSGLIFAHSALLNAVAHIAPAAALRRYNSVM